MHVRPAAPTDVPVLLDMMADFNRGEQIAWRREAGEAPLRALLADAGLGLVVVAEHADAAVGYAVVTWGYDLEWGGRDCFLTELYLRPAARGVGLGARLLAATAARARDAGAAAMHLLVRPDNPAARRLYARAGFADVPRTMMTRRLDCP